MNSVEWVAQARVRMFDATKDEGFLTRPHQRLVRINDWDTEWRDDYDVPIRAQEILRERK